MNLKEATIELEKLKETIIKAVKKNAVVENEYYKKYYDALIHSTLPSADRREAEVRELLQLDGILERYQDAKLENRLLMTEKEILFELCRNLRVLEAEYE